MSAEQRAWLVETDEWAYEEMDWVDGCRVPRRVSWRFRGLLVEIAENEAPGALGEPYELRVHTDRGQNTGAYRNKFTTATVLVHNDRVGGVGSDAWNPNYGNTGDLRDYWRVGFNPGAMDSTTLDRAEHMVIDFLAQLRRRIRNGI